MEEERDLLVLEKESPEFKTLLAIYPKEAIKNLVSNKERLSEICLSLSNAVSSASTNSIVMICGEKCPHKSVCIFMKNDLAPIGYQCPIEKKVIMEMESDIIQELEIDSNNPIEMEMLWDLIDTKILDMRASAALKDGKLTTTVTQKVGQAIVSREELAPELEIKIELKKIKANVMDAFVSTRRAKKRYGMNNDKSTLEELILKAAHNIRDNVDVNS